MELFDDQLLLREEQHVADLAVRTRLPAVADVAVVLLLRIVVAFCGESLVLRFLRTEILCTGLPAVLDIDESLFGYQQARSG